LLVEDSEEDGILLLRELRRAGYEPVCERVETADAMSNALEQQQWDVVIADYVLPRFSGPAALKLLQERGLDLPFIIVSGHIDEDTAVASMKAGAHDYVMKDRLTRLAPAVERELEEAEVRRARRQSEEQFAREQTFRRTIEESIPSGIAAVDAEGRHTYVNTAFCQMVGWSEAELLEIQPPYPYWPTESPDGVQKLMSKVAHGESPPGGFELRFRHRSGTVFDVLLLLSPIKDTRGNVAGWLGSVTDITERKGAEQRLRVQYAVARALSQEANLKAASPRILAAICESMGWDAGGLWRIAAEGREVECIGFWHAPSAAAPELEISNRDAHYKKGVGLPGRVLATGEAGWTADIGREKDLPRARAARADGIEGACAFPIRVGDKIMGVIEFFCRKALTPDDTLRQWMSSIGNQIGLFMQREEAVDGLRRAHDELEQRVLARTADLKNANAQLENAMQERKRLENELLEITEKERRRIGLDLHDDLGQKLAGLNLMMKGFELCLEKKKLPEAEDARKIQLLLEQTMHHAGGLARDLALADLREDDLPSALKSLATHVKELFSITCRFKSEGRIPTLEKNAIMQLYKITQEAVTNAVKHGKSRQVDIHLQGGKSGLVLTIRNNGLPFPSMISQSKGMGLRIMNYRANTLGGSLEITPIRPKGAMVTCTLPARATARRNGNGKISEAPQG
jgi:PAS domain S-box-containing protein